LNALVEALDLSQIKAAVRLRLHGSLGHGFHPSEDAPPERVAGTLIC
jgi:hypothetical protein